MHCSGYCLDLCYVVLMQHCTVLLKVDDQLEKAKRLCKGLMKPSEATTKALSTLFPTLQNRKRKFSPSEECVVAEKHRKKKKGNPSASGRAKMLKVICLKKIPSNVPKAVFEKGCQKKE